MPAKPFLTAKEAAGLLGISLPTLYAYVSRGLVRSEPGETLRSRRYSAEDVHKLRERKELRRDPLNTAKTMLHWGLPALDSALTLIADGRLYYRGHDALQLSVEHSFEAVASLLWTGRFDDAAALFPQQPASLPVINRSEVLSLLQSLPFIEAFQVALALQSAADPAAQDLRPERAAHTGALILQALASTAARPGLAPGASIARALSQAWTPKIKAASTLINSALILGADHELNVSAFTARCAASAASSPYNVVKAGLAALEGPRHGGHTRRVEAMLGEIEQAESVRPALSRRLRRGDEIFGFGHRLYPNGDPRARALLEQLRAALPASPVLLFAHEVVDEAQNLTGEHPTVDFTLVILSRALELPQDSPLALFALGRSAGWIGHAIEQYQQGQMIRPRARYTGPKPGVRS